MIKIRSRISYISLLVTFSIVVAVGAGLVIWWNVSKRNAVIRPAVITGYSPATCERNHSKRVSRFGNESYSYACLRQQITFRDEQNVSHTFGGFLRDDPENPPKDGFIDEKEPIGYKEHVFYPKGHPESAKPYEAYYDPLIFGIVMIVLFLPALIVTKLAKP